MDHLKEEHTTSVSDSVAYMSFDTTGRGAAVVAVCQSLTTAKVVETPTIVEGEAPELSTVAPEAPAVTIVVVQEPEVTLELPTVAAQADHLAFANSSTRTQSLNPTLQAVVWRLEVVAEVVLRAKMLVTGVSQLQSEQSKFLALLLGL